VIYNRLSGTCSERITLYHIEMMTSLVKHKLGQTNPASWVKQMFIVQTLFEPVGAFGSKYRIQKLATTDNDDDALICQSILFGS
jgi:hypothetical protein